MNFTKIFITALYAQNLLKINSEDTRTTSVNVDLVSLLLTCNLEHVFTLLAGWWH